MQGHLEETLQQEQCCRNILLSKLGIKTCRNVFYKSYATGLIPVRNGKGVRGPPSSILSSVEKHVSN